MVSFCTTPLSGASSGCGFGDSVADHSQPLEFIRVVRVDQPPVAIPLTPDLGRDHTARVDRPRKAHRQSLELRRAKRIRDHHDNAGTVAQLKVIPRRDHDDLADSRWGQKMTIGYDVALALAEERSWIIGDEESAFQP
jgi:hypothetical protein